jgi:hypothetical protein
LEGPGTPHCFCTFENGGANPLKKMKKRRDGKGNEEEKRRKRNC